MSQNTFSPILRPILIIGDVLYQDRLFCVIVKQIALRPREHTPDLEALDSKPS